MIDRTQCALFIPPRLSAFKLKLFERIGKHIGRVIKENFVELENLPATFVPIVGCTPELRPIIETWKKQDRTFIYWDRGYARRVFATHLPRGENGGYYRWHLNSFQLSRLRTKPDDRWKSLNVEVKPWQRNGRHIVVAQPTPTYRKFHGIENWTDQTIEALALVTNRQIVIRGKESKRTLQQDLEGAHCLIAHGSNAAVEAVILGCPVFVDRTSAAALVGRTELRKIEIPHYPDRQPWLNALAYSQFSEPELIDGTLWKMLEA